MEAVETVRENLANHVCSKHALHAFMNESGNRMTILCCCPQFNNHLRKDIEAMMGEDYVKKNLRFINGSVDYL
jgi:hypothetical protein